MAVSKRLRYEVLRRDNHACRYCGASAPDVTLTVDHVVPTALGGSDDPSNLVAACPACNSGKSSASADSSLVADVGADALRWAAAIKRATDAALADRAVMADVAHAVFEVFDDVPVPSYHGGGNASRFLPGDFFNSIAQFIAAGLDKVEILDAAYIATSRKVRSDSRWRYFCGVCWKKIEYRHEAARALLPTDEPPAAVPRIDPEHAVAISGYYHLSNVCDGEF